MLPAVSVYAWEPGNSGTWPQPGYGVQEDGYDGWIIDPISDLPYMQGRCEALGKPNITGAYYGISGGGVPLAYIRCSTSSTGGTWYGNPMQLVPEGECFEVDAMQGTRCINEPPPPPPPPPLPVECEEFGKAWETGEVAFIPEGQLELEAFCSNFYSKDEHHCEDVMGYFNDHQLCNDDKADCEAQGGFYGAVGLGDNVGTAICIPSDYGDDIPTCQPGTPIYLSKNLEGEGSFVCAAPLDPPKADDETSEKPEESDIDGDGIPDKDDPDMDGDGINNGSDPDADGDGIPDVDDPDSDGGDDAGSSVSGGGSCASAPVCVGDAVQCAIRRQTWEARCATEKGNQIASKGFDSLGGKLDNIGTGIGALVEAFTSTDTSGMQFDPEGTKVLETPLDDGDTDLGTDLASIFNQGGATGSCPADATLSLSYWNIDVPWTMLCNFAAMIRPLLLFFFAYSSFQILMRGF
jgi:hypothetical protein